MMVCCVFTLILIVIWVLSATLSHLLITRVGLPVHFWVTCHLPFSHLMVPVIFGPLRSALHLPDVHRAPPSRPAQPATEALSMLVPTGGAVLQGFVPSATAMPPIHLGFFLDKAH